LLDSKELLSKDTILFCNVITKGTLTCWTDIIFIVYIVYELEIVHRGNGINNVHTQQKVLQKSLSFVPYNSSAQGE
jgi:hypothetical protein